MIYDVADIAEGFAFSYVGLSMWAYIDDGFHIEFSMFILAVVIACRFVTVIVLCFICSKSCRGFKMPLSEQIAFTLGMIQRLIIHILESFVVNVHKFYFIIAVNYIRSQSILYATIYICKSNLME